MTDDEPTPPPDQSELEASVEIDRQIEEAIISKRIPTHDRRILTRQDLIESGWIKESDR